MKVLFFFSDFFRFFFFFSCYDSKDFLFDGDGKHKEAFGSACRRLETPSHPMEMSEAAVLISNSV